MNEEINMLTNLSTEAVKVAVEEYTNWYLVHSISWTVFGIGCLFFSKFLWKKAWDDDRDFQNMSGFVAILLVIIGVVAIPVNLPTLLNPKAYAIHQLLKDARGGK
jgi:hypothetical protein